MMPTLQPLDSPPGRPSSGPGWVLSVITMALLGIGVIMVHSATATLTPSTLPWHAQRAWRHTMFAAASALIVMVFWRLDYHILARAGRRTPIFPTLFLGLALLLAMVAFLRVPGLAHSVGGRYRWLRIGPIQFQPSELVKIGLLLFLSAWLTKPAVNRRHFFYTFLPAVGLIGLCLAPIITEDLSVAIQISVGATVALLLAGMPWAYILGLIAAGGAGLFALIFYSPRNWDRFQALSDPLTSTSPTAHQPKQSLLSILTGEYFGKGLGRGVIKQGYLPENVTDFIFATYCEELGLVGAVLLMILVILWIYQAYRAAVGSTDPFGRTIAGSLGVMLGLQMVLHMAVDLGRAPPTGMVLPFISAGGTALLVAGSATAIILSVASRHGAGPPNLET